MEHRKHYSSRRLRRNNSVLVVEGPVAPEKLRALRMHADLKTFRAPEDQHRALEDIAALPEGRIILARDGDTIVGYVTFHYPDEREPWGEARMEDLIEFGAIEVAGRYRSLGLGKEMLQLAFAHDQMEDAIVFATEYCWYWDLEQSKLDAWEYRKMPDQPPAVDPASTKITPASSAQYKKQASYIRVLPRWRR
ncbi:GNAT family N-acetyltransferase [Paenibacillus dendritiformis]|uniref:GNAT family N-acetyltransferase n=1 Tax=Paenibacillus dendritiformis TaxID=130049 RepID=UPI0018CE93B8|nr:GNAT family N-acetyltransferase [Paenibacillus dendritiformis]